LEVGDRLAEGLTLLRILHGFVDAALGGTDGQGADGDAAFVEDAQEVRVAAAPFAQQIALGHLDVVEGQRVRVRGVPADLVICRFGGEAGGSGGDHDRRDLGHFLAGRDRKSTRLNSSHVSISYAVFCLKKKTVRSRELRRSITPYLRRSLSSARTPRRPVSAPFPYTTLFRSPSGTWTSSKVSGCVSEEFQPTLSYAGSAVKPGVPVGIMIVEISGTSWPDEIGRAHV